MSFNGAGVEVIASKASPVPADTPLSGTGSIAARPRPPQSVEDTGLGFVFLVELISKILFQGGQLRLRELEQRSKLPVSVLEPLLAFMRAERWCEISRLGVAETSMLCQLSDTGRQRAREFLEKNQYAGPAPVPLAAYSQQVRAQAQEQLAVNWSNMQEAFADLQLPDQILQQLGSAMNSGRPIFLYGPPGSGKTTVASHLTRLLGGEVLIPHAICVNEEVIAVFDPLVHDALEAPTGGVLLERQQAFDPRWVACRRPIVVAGGELTLDLLDLEFDPGTRFYQAPPQLKANNGILIVDDLGRQLVPAQQLMNRWIVPLDRRIDYLSMHTGLKFLVPFEVRVVFSTNLAPSDLADEAFLRRLGYKILVGPLEEGAYRQLLRRVCEQFGIEFSESALDFLLQERHGRESRPLVASTAWDLLGILRDQARFRGREAVLSQEALDLAWSTYFTKG